MSIGRICTREVDLAEVEESVWQAAERMHQRTVGTLVILNRENQPIGMLTDRDLVVRVLAAGRDPHGTLVGDVMTSKPRTVSEDTPIEQVLTLMSTGPFRRIPVVDREGKLVGLVSLDDILQLLAEELTQVGQLLQREAPPAAAML